MSSLSRSVIAILAGLGLASGPRAGFATETNDEARPEKSGNSIYFSRPENATHSPLLALQAPTPGPASKKDGKVQQTEGQTPAPAPISEAERISRLQKSIEESKKELAALRDETDDPESEYSKAEADFRQTDDKLTKLKKALKDATGDDAAELQNDIDSVQKTWQLAKDRFDLAIDERKTLKEQAAAIELKLQQDQMALDKLTGATPAAPDAPVAGTPDASAIPNASVPEAVPNSTGAPDAPAPPNASASPSTAVSPSSSAAPNASAAPASPTTPPATAPAASSTANEPKPPSKELVQAKQEVQKKAEEAQQAEQDAQTVSERLATLDTNIALEQKHLQNAQKQADNASDARAVLADEFEKHSLEGAKPQELRELARKVREADSRLADARQELRRHTERLDELRSERAELLSLQVEAAKKVEQAKKQADEAEKRVARLENPFAPMNLLRWVIEHGPNILAIVLAMALLGWLSKIFSRRVVAIMAHSGIRGSKEEREARANTLVGVFHNAVSVTIWIGGVLMILQESGIPVAPLLGGAAVFGLAIAFGAQNLIRDYFYGFVILLENQYKINDVVKIGDDSGLVERITLRITVLRDQEGCVHFIPNGQITTVINMTHGWSRALFEVAVDYNEDVDRVIEVLHELGRELRADPDYKLLILDDLEMLGVDALAESAVIVKFFIKTRTLKQWTIKREMLRRIKKRFDERGIKHPFPHRTIDHRLENTDLPQPDPQSVSHAVLRGQHRTTN